ncbi:hypothetical protein LOD99_14025 [Oopsacas minuta]|uniref:Tudor domain-containing protein n=1 Tax=Oopsacas minuta TaxID=111878 RepID=A0AAV7KJS1_9METZ|nr:hypothetical protein LOD99_14025 [Oopsacas minuta]
MSRGRHNFLDRCRVVLDVIQQVCVKEVHSSGCFYIQLLETADAYKLDEMYSRLEREVTRPPWRKYTPRLGEIILSYSTARASLCRSEVVSLQSNNVRVFHVDYGSYESVPLSRVTALPNHALQPTRQAIKCCLSNATCLSSEGLDSLRRLSLGKELEGKLLWSYDSICYYILLTQPSGKSSIGELLISHGMATPLVKCNVLEPCLQSACHMSTVVSPSEIYFRSSTDLKKLQELQEIMNSPRLSPFKSMAPLSEKLTREGAYCLIQNPADLLKYRARVTCVRPSDKTAQVHLIDFGHTINVTYEQMFSMTPDAAEQTALCFICSLNLRPIKANCWGLEVRERLLSLGENTRMNFEVSVKNRIGTVHWLQVFIPGKGEPLEELLSDMCVIENNYYLSMYRSPHGLTLEVDDGEAVCITCVVDWNKFYVQLTKHSRELDWLTERLAESFSDTELDEQWLRSPTEGVLCATPYYEANTWARAVVTSVPHCTADKVQVFYIDYGNRDEVLPYDLKIIPTFAMHHPAMAIECGLHSTKLLGAYNLEEFRALVSQKALYMTVHENTRDRYLISLVDKLAGGINILESLELRSQSPLSPLSPRSMSNSPLLSPVAMPMRSLPLNNKIEVLCTYTESPNHFKCQLLSNTDSVLSDITRDLQRVARETATRLNTRDIRLGMPIMAFNTEDRLWYRAVVLDKEQRGFTIDLVDYGNKIKVQAHEMTHLPIQFISIPAFSITCKIYLNIPQRWSEDECETFKEIILGNKFKAVPKSVERRVYGIEIIGQEMINKLGVIGMDIKKRKHSSAPKHFLKPLRIKPCPRIKMCISYFENPGSFYCQLEENTMNFTKFQDRLGLLNIQTFPEYKHFDDGDFCISLYIDDTNLYRAKILSTDTSHDSAEVLYVDFGDKEIASLKSLRAIPEEFAQLPMQAIHCSLWEMHPIGTLEGGWHSDSKEVTENFLGGNLRLFEEIQKQTIIYTNHNRTRIIVEILHNT